jgi:hypothetical protein
VNISKFPGAPRKQKWDNKEIMIENKRWKGKQVGETERRLRKKS